MTWLNSDTDANNKEALTKYFLSRKGTASADSLNLPEDLNTKLKAVVFDTNFKATDFNLKPFDFKWITELQQFDYWSLEDNSPIAYLEKYDFTKYPIPDFSPMIAWAKLRLIKGLQDNNIGQAIDETLHLGRILHSTETLSGALTGIMIQEQVLKFAQTQHKPLRFDSAVLNKAKIYFTALGKALSIPFIDARTYLKLLQINSGPGFCAAINTAAPTLLLYRASLEGDLQPIYKSITNLMTLTLPCRWKIIHSAWGGDQRYPKQFTNLASLGIKGRKKETDAIKTSLTPEEYQQLQHEIPNPRWPQYYVYMLALKINLEQLFTELNSK